MTSSFRRPLMAAASGGILALLSIYVLIGTPLAPFHGDESMNVWSSGDSEMLTGLGPWSLTVSPPYVVDSPQHFRLATGSIYKHWLGLIRRLAGLGQDVLPPAPGWDWASDYKTNEAMGHVPRPELLAVARLSAVLLSALAIWPASLIGGAVATGAHFRDRAPPTSHSSPRGGGERLAPHADHCNPARIYPPPPGVGPRNGTGWGRLSLKPHRKREPNFEHPACNFARLGRKFRRSPVFAKSRITLHFSCRQQSKGGGHVSHCPTPQSSVTGIRIPACVESRPA